MTDRLHRRPLPPLPIFVLTGFLGAGKTTLLNALLRDPALADTIVLINEFGDVGLDHLLVERIDGDMLLMASGCLCCTIRGDLVRTLEDLLRRLDNPSRSPSRADGVGAKPFSRVLIETTGLADPVPILQTLIGHPYFALRFRLEGVVTVIDAVHGADTLDRHAEARRQVALADTLVLSKSDLADPAALVALRDRLHDANPTSPIFDGAKGEATTAALLAGAPSAAALRLPKDNGHVDGGHDHDGHTYGEHAGHGHHQHDRSRHGDTIRSFTLTHDRPIEPAAFSLFLELLRHAHGPKLLRLKGLVALADDPARPLVVHAVQHLLHPPTRLPHWPDSDGRTRLVLIADGLDEAYVRSLFDTVRGEIAPDRPDMVALRNNPLAIDASNGLFR